MKVINKNDRERAEESGGKWYAIKHADEIEQVMRKCIGDILSDPIAYTPHLILTALDGCEITDIMMHHGVELLENRRKFRVKLTAFVLANRTMF